MRAMMLVVTLLFAAGSQGQPPSAADLARLGPQVGQKVPDFALVDQTGATRNLKSILGPNGAMLVFYRSAEW
jgi:hypothetical protein